MNVQIPHNLLNDTYLEVISDQTILSLVVTVLSPCGRQRGSSEEEGFVCVNPYLNEIVIYNPTKLYLRLSGGN